MSACLLVDEVIALCFQQLTAEEERAYQSHATTCTACRLKLAEVRETVDLLSFAAPPVAPPANLKERILGQVAAEAAQRPEPSTGKRRRTLSVWTVAAAVAALMIGSYSLLQIEGLQQRLAGFQAAAPVERTVSLAGSPLALGAHGRLVVAREGGGTRLALQAQGLPALEPGEAYQLWLIKDGKRISGGVFVVDATGTGGVATWLPGPVEFDALGITREPDALGLQPRGQKMMGSL